jgi:hypothetical protein
MWWYEQDLIGWLESSDGLFEHRSESYDSMNGGEGGGKIISLAEQLSLSIILRVDRLQSWVYFSELFRVKELHKEQMQASLLPRNKV